MAERSLFWKTDGVGHGPIGGYPQHRLRDWTRKLFLSGEEDAAGVLFNTVDGQLAVSGSVSPLTVASGSALAYGFLYENTSELTKAVTTPTTGLTGGRVLIRATWSTQEVLVEAVRSADGVTAPPDLVQREGEVWEISLASFLITPGGAITVTDDRSFVHFGTKVSGNMIDPLAVSTGKIADAAVSNAKFRASSALSVVGRAVSSSGAVQDIVAAENRLLGRGAAASIGFIQATTEMLADLIVSTAKLAANAVTNAKFRQSVGTSVVGRSAGSTGNVDDIQATVNERLLARTSEGVLAWVQATTNMLGPSSVDDTKLGNRVIQFRRRQGGNAANWSVPGASSHTPTKVRMQAGKALWTGTAASFGNITVTFPEAFSQLPLLQATIAAASGGEGWRIVVNANASSASAAFISWRSFDATTFTSVEISWLATGEE